MSGVYVSVRNGGNVSRTVSKALQEEVTSREAAFSYGAYQAGDVRVHIKASAFAGVTPKPGDKWTPTGGAVLTVLTASLESLRTRWELQCRNLAIAFDLRQLIEVWGPGPIPVRDSLGFRKPTVVQKYSAVAARLQETAASQVEQRGKRGDRRQFVVYVADDLELTTDDEIRCGGETYTVDGWQNRQRIDELMSINASLLFRNR